MNKTIIIALVTFLMTSCTSQKDIMNSWVGQAKQKLIMSWGPPSRTASDGSTGEILVYAKQVYIPAQTSTFYDGGGGSVSNTKPAENFWDYKFFYVNSSGVIYYWMTQQQQIPPIQIDLNVYKRY
jgi:hypothetical protein